MASKKLFRLCHGMDPSISPLLFRKSFLRSRKLAGVTPWIQPAKVFCYQIDQSGSAKLYKYLSEKTAHAHLANRSRSFFLSTSSASANRGLKETLSRLVITVPSAISQPPVASGMRQEPTIHRVRRTPLPQGQVSQPQGIPASAPSKDGRSYFSAVRYHETAVLIIWLNRAAQGLRRIVEHSLCKYIPLFVRT
jgi:hypothetical protein